MRRKDPAALAVVQQALESGEGTRQRLSRWMLIHYADIGPKLEEAQAYGELNWSRLTEAFMGLGFRNSDGSALKSETVRRTFYRVRERHRSLENMRREKRTEGRKPTIVEVGASAGGFSAALKQSESSSACGSSSGMSSQASLAEVIAEMRKRSGLS